MPSLFLICSVTGGVLNMVLDYVLITGFDMGISGAAVATRLVTRIITMMFSGTMLALVGKDGVAAALCLTRPLVSVFARPDNPVYDLAVTGNRICTAALLFIGFNIFAGGMFTALSNGIVSAVLAFSRPFVFMLAAMLALPRVLGVNGIWMATPAADGNSDK